MFGFHAVWGFPSLSLVFSYCTSLLVIFPIHCVCLSLPTSHQICTFLMHIFFSHPTPPSTNCTHTTPSSPVHPRTLTQYLSGQLVQPSSTGRGSDSLHKWEVGERVQPRPGHLHDQTGSPAPSPNPPHPPHQALRPQ